MHGSLQGRVDEARKIERKIVQGTARICSPSFGKAWKGIYPLKAAEELAARIGCSVRTAAYEISGEHEPSARSIQALINEIMPRRE